MDEHALKYFNNVFTYLEILKLLAAGDPWLSNKFVNNKNKSS